MHCALKCRKPRQIIDKLMKFVVDPGYADDKGENLIHLAARIKDSSVLQTFFEAHDCTSALGVITKSGCCALTYAVRNGLNSNVKFLMKEYEAADVRTIRLIVQNALQRKGNYRVLEVMRTSKVLSGYLEAEQSRQKTLIHGSIDCTGTTDECQTPPPCRITGESLIDVAGNSRSGVNENVIMEDAG
jgi:hypothetical protein